MNKQSYLETRIAMSRIAKCMWDRRLTNAAGGNFAVKVDDNRMLISPSLMSERNQCVLDPSDFLLVDFDLNIYEGEGKLSRESRMHSLILKNFKNIGATIHAHPFWCMPFVAFSKPIPSNTEATLGRGEVECNEYIKAYTPELAESVYRFFDQKRELAEKKPQAVIMPLHGVCVTGSDLFTAYSMLERIEAEAFCHLMRNNL